MCLQDEPPYDDIPIERRIEDETNAALRLNSMKRLHDKLATQRAELRAMAVNLPWVPDSIRLEVSEYINSTDNLMWTIETAIRGETSND